MRQPACLARRHLVQPRRQLGKLACCCCGCGPEVCVEVVEAQLRNLNEIEAAMAQWGREPDYG